MSRLSFVSLTLALSLPLGVLATLGACDRQSSEEAQLNEEPAAPTTTKLSGTLDRTNAGSAIPQFKFSDPDGKELDLEGLNGTPVLLNLWATWCAPCVLEMPMLDDLAGENEGKFRVITISQDIKGAEKVVPFFAERSFTHLEPWLDTNSDLAFHFGGGQLPTTILYGADGKEIWRVAGEYDWTSEDTYALIAEAF